MPAFPILKISPPGHFVEIDGDTLFLGRDCHLATFIAALLNKVVSNRHCVVRREGDRWMLEDLGSTNGTWIRGTRLFGRVLLHTGDTFSLGKGGPSCECASGFGGTGPDATVAEDGHSHGHGHAERTMLVDQPKSRAAARDEPDGTMNRPFKVGKTPEIGFLHQGSGKTYQAKGYTIVLGRDPGGAQIVFRGDDEKHVSGRHAEIQFRTDGVAVIRDLGSSNGTWLNDRPVKSELPIKRGDRLVLGAAGTTLIVTTLES